MNVNRITSLDITSSDSTKRKLKMQITALDAGQVAEILASATTHLVLESPGTSRTHILTAIEGRNITLIVCGSTGEGSMIDECRHDHEVGGSIHDQARAECV